MHYYLHIPFCRQKCPYCKFALTPIFDDIKKRRYLAHLKKEIGEYISGSRTLEHSNIQNTVYFGGGTPSVLSLDEVREILDCFSIIEDSNIRTVEHSDTEISFECNPEDVTDEYIQGLLSLGINRLSIGVQSLSDTTLKAIQRSDRESIFHALDQIVSVLCTMPLHSALSINIDLILGLPYSRPGETLANLRELHTLYPHITHTSVYMLEDGHYPKEWKKDSITESEMEHEYRDICEYFESIGWHHYEISSWSRPGYECVHNQGYWTHRDVRGFGLSATSFEKLPPTKMGQENFIRTTNSESFAGYYRGEKSHEETLGAREKYIEQIIYGLRTFSLDRSLFDTTTLDILEEKGWIQKGGEKIILTPTGIFRENTILSEILNF